MSHSNREKVELHKLWWARTNPRPLVGLFAPVTMPYGGLDVEVLPGEIEARKRRNAEATAQIPGDKLVVACVNFSTAFVPALAGAGFQHDAHTSWSIPVATSARDLRVQPFDPGHPLFQAYLRRLEPLLAGWTWDTYLPGLADYLGPMDILAAMLGPETLSIELYEHPAEVKRHAMDAAQLLRDMLAFELQLHREAGLVDGVTECFCQWMPGKGLRFAEDVSALMGAAHFREFFVAADSHWLGGLDSTFMHTHSAAAKSMAAILDIRNLGAVEISNDPNGPCLEAIVAAAQQVQARGLPVQISNWEHPLTEHEIAAMLGALDPRGLCITLQAASLEEARNLYQRFGGQ